jgi:hypothetical protein
LQAKYATGNPATCNPQAAKYANAAFKLIPEILDEATKNPIVGFSATG